MTIARSLAWGAIVLMVGPQVSAFSKFEHEQLTYYAHEAVRARACVGESRSSPLCSVDIDSSDLAVVARGVDYYSIPARLAPDPDDCPTKGRSHCRKGALRDNACQGATFDFDGCAAAAVKSTLENVDKRRNKWFYRLLAVHRNDEHFRGTACGLFNQMHGRAAELAATGTPELALVAEAVAVHFLQDVMAPGHLAAPRDQFGDWQAGAVHDRHNRRGLPVAVAEAVCDGANRLGEISAIESSVLWSDWRQGRLLPWDQLSQDLAALRQSCDGGLRYTAHGDKSLLPRITLYDARLHAAAVLAVTAAAFEDLYGIADRPPVRMYYEAPYFDPGSKRAYPPVLGLWAHSEPPMNSSSVCFRRPVDADELFTYETIPEVEGQAMSLHPFHSLNTVQIAYSTWGEARRRWELTWDGIARERLLTRRDDGALEKAKLFRTYLGVASYSLHHEQLQGNDVWGLGLLYNYSRHFTKFRDFDYFFGFEPGIGYYHLDGDTTTRFRGSVRAGIGFSVLALEALGERGRSLDPGGDAEGEWRWSLNLRVRLAPTWWRRAVKDSG